MLLALVLSSVLAQDTGFVPDIGQRRAETRGFFGASLVGAASYGAGFGLGVGLQLEGGATFNDQLSLGLRAFASTLLLSVDTGAAVGLDLLLNEYFSVGIGVGAPPHPVRRSTEPMATRNVSWERFMGPS